MTIEEHLAQALVDVRQRNALRINALRAVGTAAFVLTIAVMAYGLGENNWRPVFLPTTAYFLIALGIMAGGKASPKFLRISRFAIPAFDMPMVFTIQLINLQAATVPGHVSEFSIALFVCLLMLSAFTLSSGQICISLILAIAFEQILQGVAGMGIGAQLGSTIIMFLTAWMCIFAGRNRLRLVTTVTQANARRMRLQRYFSPGVGELLEQQDEEEMAQGQECALTVVFTDIRGFTSLSEQLDSHEVIQLLNSYHAAMVEAVFRHGGTLDKYLGDGLMAYFNAPVGQPDHAVRAVRSALTMLDALADLNSSRAQRGERPLAMGVGIHTGNAVVGDIGAPQRREFTAVGHTVNIASKIEEATKEFGVGVLVSEATVELVTDEVQWREVGELTIGEGARPVRLFTPVI